MILHNTLSFALVVKDLSHTRLCSKLLGGENGTAWNNKFQRSSENEQAKNKWWRLSSTVSQRGHKRVTSKPHLLSLSRVGILSRAATHVINVCFGIYPWNQTDENQAIGGGIGCKVLQVKAEEKTAGGECKVLCHRKVFGREEFISTGKSGRQARSRRRMGCLPLGLDQAPLEAAYYWKTHCRTVRLLYMLLTFYYIDYNILTYTSPIFISFRELYVYRYFRLPLLQFNIFVVSDVLCALLLNYYDKNAFYKESRD